MTVRCGWAGEDPLYVSYHDTEWGVPLHDDQSLFEFLLLDGFQAGLSWITILRKRESYRRAFHRFDAKKIAAYDARKRASLMKDPGIIRNKLKIAAAVQNARAFLRLQGELGSFDAYIWSFVDGRTKKNSFRSLAQVPSETRQSRAMSKDLKSRGFTFVGPTICYAFMQAAGLVNDHLVTCFRYGEV
jgi:DNA-3-methyladenine glycosylase I